MDYLLRCRSGEIIWANNDGVAYRAFNVWNGIIAYGRTYWHDLGSGINGATKCLDLETGKELWRARTDMYIGYYQTVCADGKIYGRQSDYSLTTGRDAIPIRFSCWDAYTGAEIWSIELTGAWPIIAYGCLFVGTDSNWQSADIVCLSTASTLNHGQCGAETWKTRCHF
jgi:outer membrane protein assembly factor BamB